MSFPWSSGDKLDASDLNDMFKFQGDGGDGSKTVDSSEDIDAGGATYVLKEYSDLTIDADQTLGVGTPSAYGTLLHIKVQGDCIINGKIDLSECGGEGGAGVSGASGNNGENGAFSLNPDIHYLGYAVGFDDAAEWHISRNFRHGGIGGDGGSSVGGKRPGAGGGGGGYEDGEDGGSNIENQYGWGGGGGKKQLGVGTDLGYHLYLPNRLIVACCGGGGGSGGAEDNDDISGDGGNGGGGLIIEVGGNLTFGASSEIDLSGGDAGTPTNQGEGSGGGGGGIGLILYKGTLTDNGLTKTVSGGSGSEGTHCTGGDGGDGRIELIENKEFA